MQDRFLRAAFACLVTAVGISGSALAATSYSGELNATSRTWNRVGNSCAPTQAIEWFHAQVFTVDAAGSYTFSQPVLTGAIQDTFFALYNDTFSPANPVANCLATDDDAGAGSTPLLTENLEAGKAYVLVTTQFGAGTGSGVDASFTNSITGPGNIALIPSLVMDIDGNGEVDALTDGLLLIRWQFGLRGASLIAGAVGVGASRSTAAAIEDYLAKLGLHAGPRMIVETAKVGGEGGGAYTRDCASGSAAIGLIAQQAPFIGTPPNIGRITIVCAPIVYSPLGSPSIGAPTTNLPDIGDANGTTGSLTCNPGSVITGLEGSTQTDGGSNFLVENLALQCTPLSGGSVSIVGPLWMANSIPFTLPCPTGTMMRGLAGRADQAIDSLRVRCS